MGLREENRLRVRRRILEASERLFRAQGFDATPVEVIAAEARVSRQTFFNYFPSKQQVLAELALAWLQRQAELPAAGADRVDAERAAGRSVGVIAGLRASLRTQLEAIEADRDFMRLVFTRSGVFFPQGPEVGSAEDKPRLDRTLPMFQGVAAIVRAGQASGEIRAELNPLQVAEIWVSVMVITIRLWITDYWPADAGLAPSLTERVDGVVDVLVAGLQPRTAQERDT
jgi:AcrR family transcriptional regulator